MKAKKYAFTIPELLIFITIVGVVSVLMMSILKPTERYFPYSYYNAYNTLKTAALNIREDAVLNRQDTHEDILEADKFFPGAMSSEDENYAKTSAQELCKKLAITASSADTYGYINTTEYYCTSFTPVSNTGSFSDADDKSKYAFRATNSMLFYISELGTVAVKDDMDNENSVDISYFIVWVDLNGDRLPNSATWTENKMADIVPFIVTTGGHVLPAGGPITDIRYTTSRVQYSTDSVVKYLPQSMSYLEAQIRAYGDKEYPTFDLHSINATFREQFKDTLYAKNEAEIDAVVENTSIDDKCALGVDNMTSCMLVVDEITKL